MIVLYGRDKSRAKEPRSDQGMDDFEVDTDLLLITSREGGKEIVTRAGPHWGSQ